MNGNKTGPLFWQQYIGLVKRWTYFFLPFITFIKPEQKTELLEMKDTIGFIVKPLPAMLRCNTLKWLYFAVKYCYSKRFKLPKMQSFFKILYTSQF